MQSHARVELAMSRSGKVTFSLSLQLDARLFPVRLPCLEFVGTKGRSGMEIGFLWFSESFLGVLQFFLHRGFKNSDNFMVAMFPTVFWGKASFKPSDTVSVFPTHFLSYRVDQKFGITFPLLNLSLNNFANSSLMPL